LRTIGILWLAVGSCLAVYTASMLVAGSFAVTSGRLAAPAAGAFAACCGYGLARGRTWAKILACILAAVAIFLMLALLLILAIHHNFSIDLLLPCGVLLLALCTIPVILIKGREPGQ
jgi:hypothetical protein